VVPVRRFTAERFVPPCINLDPRGPACEASPGWLGRGPCNVAVAAIPRSNPEECM
jgi:hypothetical protein